MTVITDKYLSSLKPGRGEAFDVFDSNLPGFGVTVGENANIEFFIKYESKSWNSRLGKLETITHRQHFGAWDMDSPNPDWRIYNCDIARGQASLALIRVKQNKIPFEENELEQGSTQKFGDFLDEFIEKHAADKDLAPRTISGYREMFERIKPVLGDVPLCHLTKEKISAYHRNRAVEKPDPRTPKKKIGGRVRANRELALIKCALNRAIEWEYIKHNPAVGITKFKEKARDVWAQDDELIKLMKQIQKDLDKGCVQYRDTIDAVRLALLTGARKQEIRTFEKKYFTFSQTERGEVGIWKKPPYTTKSRQWEMSSLSPEAVKIIKERMEMTKGSPFLFPHRKDRNKPRLDFEGWSKYRKKVNCEHLHFHDLRHTASTHAVMENANVYDVSKALDHKDVSTTERYTHADLRAKEKAASCFEDNMLRWMEKAG